MDLWCALSSNGFLVCIENINGFQEMEGIDAGEMGGEG